MSAQRSLVPPSQPVKSPIIPKEVSDNLAIAFEFNLFQTQSIKCGDFHNYCENRAAAIEQIGDLFCSLRDMSQHKRKELEVRPLRNQFHWHRIEDDKPIRRIEKVLSEGYHMPTGTINEFENEYVEFSCSNGQRVICAVHDNVVVPLFMDPNHLICQEGSSRNVAQKMSWSYPSLLYSDKAPTKKTISPDDEARKSIIDEIKQGKLTEISEIQQLIKEFGI